MKYKIVSIKDRNGNDKTDFYNEMKAVHPNLSGEFLYPEYTKVGGHFCLVWDDNTRKMLRTSTVEDMADDGDGMIIVTRNSVYTLEKVGDTY